MLSLIGTTRTASRARLLAASLCAAVATGAFGCHGAEGGAREIAVRCEVSPSPPVTGPAEVSVWLADSDRSPVTGAKVRIEGDMTHPGMAPVFADASEVEPGRYRSTLDLTMAGDWVLTIRSTLSDGRTLEERVDLRGVRGR